MGFKEKVLKQIISLGDKGYTISELENKLNFRSRMERKIFASAIRDLIKDGSIVDKGKGRLVAVSRDNLIKGDLRGNKRGYAFLIREDKGPDLFVPNRSLGGAMHGDTVLVRQTGDSEGSVVSVVKRGVLQMVGTYILSGKFGFVVADDDNYFKDVFIPFDKVNGARPLSKVVINVKIDPNNNKPVGEVIEVLGQSGESNAEVLSILRNYGFSETFPSEVLKAAESVEFKIEGKRTDLRDLLTITIDGEDAKDFDDAISIEKIKDGFRLYVHIADVSHYVKGGSVLDREALSRATSVYFPGSVFPMLPEGISNGVCSLRPDEEKLTVTAMMDITPSGRVKNSEFMETITRSNYRMTYTQVTKILDGDKELRDKYKEIVKLLEDARELSDILAKVRNDRGTINFATKESKIILDDKGDVVDIKPYPYEVSNSIIEHFMILANEAVAEYTSSNNLPSVYRVHEVPSEVKMQAFNEFINGLGYSLNVSDGVKPNIFSDFL